MANRILITDSVGSPLACLDGYHGARHAADWTTAVLQDFADQGVDAIALELKAFQGGDHFRRDVLEQAGRLRVELRDRPDGMREIVGIVRYASPEEIATVRELRASKGKATPDGHLPSAAGVGKGLPAAVAAPLTLPVRCTLNIVQAPEQVVGDRRAIRVSRGRQNIPLGQPRTIEEIRRARRLLRASQRQTAMDHGRSSER